MAGQIPNDSFAGSLSDPGIDPFEIPEVPELPVTPAGQARTSAKPVPGPISPDRKLPPENLYSRMRSNVLNALGLNTPELTQEQPNPAYSPRFDAAAQRLGNMIDPAQYGMTGELAGMVGGAMPGTMASEVPLRSIPVWGGAKMAMHGGMEEAPFREAMLKDFGSKIEPQLGDIYQKSKGIYEANIAKAPLNELSEQHLPNLQNIVDQYNKGQEGADWYLNTRPELEQQFGPDTDLFINLLAATSPNNTVPANLTQALKAYKAYKNNIPFEAVHPGWMKSVIGNMNRAVNGEPLHGQKIINFAKNLRGETEPVTVDRWMMRALGMPTARIGTNTYKFADYWLSQIAHDMGVEPRQLQAAVWKTAREVGGQSAATGQPFEAMLAKKLAKDPDLGALLNRVRQAAPPPPVPPPVPRPTRQQIMAPLYARGGLAKFQSGGIAGQGPESPAVTKEEHGMRMIPPPVKSQEEYANWLGENYYTLQDAYNEANPKGTQAGFEQWLPTPPNAIPELWKAQRAQWLQRFQGKAKDWPMPSGQSPEVEVRQAPAAPTRQQKWLNEAAWKEWQREVNKPIQQQEHQAKSLAPGMSPLTKDYPPLLNPVEYDDVLGKLRGDPNIPPGPVPGAPPVKLPPDSGPPASVTQLPPGVMPGTILPIPYGDDSDDDPWANKTSLKRSGGAIDGGWYGQNSSNPIRMGYADGGGTPSYDTPIPQERQADYQRWLGILSPNLRSTNDYDLQGAFLAGAQPSGGHLTDQFKKPNHMTFSDESQYSDPTTGLVGGRWTQGPDKSWTFYASPTNLKYHSTQELQNYFRQAEPGNRLVLPQAQAKGGPLRMQDGGAAEEPWDVAIPTDEQRRQLYQGDPLVNVAKASQLPGAVKDFFQPRPLTTQGIVNALSPNIPPTSLGGFPTSMEQGVNDSILAGLEWYENKWPGLSAWGADPEGFSKAIREKQEEYEKGIPNYPGSHLLHETARTLAGVGALGAVLPEIEAPAFTGKIAQKFPPWLANLGQKVVSGGLEGSIYGAADPEQLAEGEPFSYARKGQQMAEGAIGGSLMHPFVEPASKVLHPAAVEAGRLAGETALDPHVQQLERSIEHAIPLRAEEAGEQAAAQSNFPQKALKQVLHSLDDVVRPHNIGQGISGWIQQHNYSPDPRAPGLFYSAGGVYQGLRARTLGALRRR